MIPHNDQVTNSTSWHQQFDYDSLNRLERVHEYTGNTALDWQQEYVYDRWGNRTVNQTNTWGLGINKKDFSVNTTNNRLGVPSGQTGTMTYDNAGNLVTDTYSGSGVTRVYDAENRMKSETQANNYVAGVYTYNADGQRVRRKVDGIETWQVYGMDGELLAEYAAGVAPASAQKEYGYRNGQLLIVGTGQVEKIVFHSVRDGNYEIYTMNTDGTSPTRITNNSAADEYPVWSPDNSKIAFTSNRDGNREVYVMNADGTNQTRLTTASGDDQYPAWAPDGSKLTFRSYRDGNDEIYSMNADGSGQTRLTNNTALDLSPDWSPDGTKIVFYTNRHTNFQIYVMNADGSGQTRLSNNSHNDYHPAWSPNGSKIAFYSLRDGNREIYVMNADGSGQTRLTNTTSLEQNPAWSKDGNKIAFFSDRDGNLEVYSMNAADGSNQTRLTNSAGDDTYPDWPKAGNAIQWLVADHLGTPRIVIDKTGSLAKVKRHDYLPFGEELYAGTGNRTTTLGYSGDNEGVKGFV